MYRIEFTGGKETEEKLRAVKERSRAMGPYFSFAGLAMVRSIQKNFQQGGRPEKWKPSIRVQWGGGKTLSKTAQLRQSVTSESNESSATIGTNDRRAKILHFGGVIRPKKVKALPVPLNKEAQKMQEDLNGKSLRSLKASDSAKKVGMRTKREQRMRDISESKRRGRKKASKLFTILGHPGILFMKKSMDMEGGRVTKLQPMFVLKKSVTIPSRPYLIFQDSDVSRLNKAAEKFMLTGKAE